MALRPHRHHSARPNGSRTRELVTATQLDIAGYEWVGSGASAVDMSKCDTEKHRPPFISVPKRSEIRSAPVAHSLPLGTETARPFLPALNFATSKAFYAALGFALELDGDDVAIYRIGATSFLLQHHYQKEWAETS
jgi:hypothetical protein